MAKRPLWECPKCHAHFYLDVVQDGTAICDKRDSKCPARDPGRPVPHHGSGPDNL